MTDVTVKVRDRTFTVSHDDEGKPLIVKERKIHTGPYGHQSFYNSTYWHWKHHGVGRPGSLIAEVLAAAKTKLEQRASQVI